MRGFEDGRLLGPWEWVRTEEMMEEEVERRARFCLRDDT